MSSISKSLQKKIYSHNAFATILSMRDYMVRHSKKEWHYRDVVFRLHLDYDTHKEILKHLDRYYKVDPYIMGQITKRYEAMKKPAQDRYISRRKMVETIVKKVRKSKDKQIHEIIPLSFRLDDKDYGNMPFKYVASRIVFDKDEDWNPSWSNEPPTKSIKDFPDRFKQDISWYDEYDKLHMLIHSFGEGHFFDVMKYMIEVGIRIPSMDMVKLVLIIIGYVYGINSNALLCETNKMSLLEEVTGELWQEEHLRYKMLWLYESGVFTDLYKEDLDELTKFKNVLIHAPLNKFGLVYQDLEYFCTKYNLNIDAMTGKYLPIREDIPSMTSLEFKNKLRFKEIFLKDI